jgi:hypothetical protein
MTCHALSADACIHQVLRCNVTTATTTSSIQRGNQLADAGPRICPCPDYGWRTGYLDDGKEMLLKSMGKVEAGISAQFVIRRTLTRRLIDRKLVGRGVML